jgi:hypothetical protein
MTATTYRKVVRAGWSDAGSFCRRCDEEIVDGDLIFVDEDAEIDMDGCYRDLTVREHVECPPEQA